MMNEPKPPATIGILYSLQVYDSGLDYLHGFKHDLIELYIPTLNVALNYGSGDLVLFRFPADNPAKNRYAEAIVIKNVEVSDTLLLTIAYYLDCQGHIEKETKGLFKQDYLEEAEHQRDSLQ